MRAWQAHPVRTATRSLARTGCAGFHFKLLRRRDPDGLLRLRIFKLVARGASIYQGGKTVSHFLPAPGAGRSKSVIDHAIFDRMESHNSQTAAGHFKRAFRQPQINPCEKDSPYSLFNSNAAAPGKTAGRGWIWTGFEPAAKPAIYRPSKVRERVGDRSVFRMARPQWALAIPGALVRVLGRTERGY